MDNFNIYEALRIVFSGMIGTLGFSLLFRSNRKFLIWNSVGGALTCLVYVVVCAFSENMFWQNFFPALLATAFAEIMARLLKTPATPILACSIIPLVPGGKLYYTTYYFVTSEMDMFRITFSETLRIAAGIAVGIICVSVIVNEINRHKFRQILDID